jgi:Tfp pilus assembly protein PilN
MRELEFLPEWYPQSRRRKRIVLLQGYMTLLLAGGLFAWFFLAQRNTENAAAALAGINMQISQTHQEMHQLEEQVALKSQLLLQRQIGEKLGMSVEMSRLLYALDQKMPPAVSLTNLSFDTHEQLKAANSLATARAATAGENIDRRLHVRLDGVALTDNDVANFLTGLSRVPFFDDVAMSYSRDQAGNRSMMREFEITFSVNLNQESGG